MEELVRRKARKSLSTRYSEWISRMDNHVTNTKIKYGHNSHIPSFSSSFLIFFFYDIPIYSIIFYINKDGRK